MSSNGAAQPERRGVPAHVGMVLMFLDDAEAQMGIKRNILANGAGLNDAAQLFAKYAEAIRQDREALFREATGGIVIAPAGSVPKVVG